MSESTPLPAEQRAAERDRLMRLVGAYNSITVILKDLWGSVPNEDQDLLRLHQDMQRWANKAYLRAWEVADGHR